MSDGPRADAVETTPVPTPCIGVCKIDESSGLCLGCARNPEEIGAWRDATPFCKRAVWEALPPRRARLGLTVSRLPWSSGDIGGMIERTLRTRSGRWSLGIEGAMAIFEIGPEEDVDIVCASDRVEAITSRGALRLIKNEKTIAFAFGNAADPRGPEAIGLVIPRGRVDLRKGGTVQDAGLDEAAIGEAHRGARLYDLGVAPELAARYCLRTGDAGLIAALDSAAGMQWRQALPHARGQIAKASPHVVVETGLGRVEVFAAAMADNQECPRADLDEGLEPQRELPPHWTLDGVFAPCALFYPHIRQPAEALRDGRI